MSEIGSLPTLTDLLNQRRNAEVASNGPQGNIPASAMEGISGISPNSANFLSQQIQGSGEIGTANTAAGKYLGQPLSGNPGSQAASSISAKAGPFATAGTGAPGFADMFEGLVRGVDAKAKVGAQKKRDILLGKSDNVADAMVAMQEAGVAFNLMLEVRNKLVESYKELLRMRV
tara:strand:+ start:1261 stop:1782 length:522 start_codon:yes stop_codon:yes gene_type:complete